MLNVLIQFQHSELRKLMSGRAGRLRLLCGVPPRVPIGLSCFPKAVVLLAQHASMCEAKTTARVPPHTDACWAFVNDLGPPSLPVVQLTCSSTASPPLVGNLGNGLWEVRSRLEERIARVIFFVEGRTMVLLHGFIKKTQKTPKHELDLAIRRKDQLK